MIFYCDADLEVSCTVRNCFEAGEKCKQLNCPFLKKSDDINPCRCQGLCTALIYEVGQAQQWVVGNRKGRIEWVEPVNYIVRCPICGTATSPFPTLGEAVAAWNGGEAGC